MAEALNPPQSDVSDAKATKTARFAAVCGTTKGEHTSVADRNVATIADTRDSYSANDNAAPCTLCSLADETIFIAEVIFSVLCTEAIRPLISLSDAIRLCL